MIRIHLIKLKSYPIFQQLQLEEALLRADSRNWCIINEGSTPSIVMGISGKHAEMIHPDHISQQPIPVIRRFSGGGTVIVDENTLFTTLILNKNEIQVPCCPQKIMHWTGEIYHSILPDLEFSVRENDYVLGNKKFGGNAQYMCKDRWLHHTSLIWDYDRDRMDCLLFPPKTPSYRGKRSHTEFLCKLSEHMSHKSEFIDAIINALGKKFHIVLVPLEEAVHILERPHRKATTFIES